jgi:hypothetical protein
MRTLILLVLFVLCCIYTIAKFALAMLVAIPMAIYTTILMLWDGFTNDR